MKTKIAIEIDSAYLPSLHALLYREMKEAHELTEDERFTKKFPNLNEEMKAAKELANDEKFAKEYPHLTKRALLTVINLTAILYKLEEQF